MAPSRQTSFQTTRFRQTAFIQPQSSYWSSFQLPTLATSGLTRNYQNDIKSTVDKDQFIQRIDFTESSNSNWFGLTATEMSRASHRAWYSTARIC
jgi:hypothetical protein